MSEKLNVPDVLRNQDNLVSELRRELREAKDRIEELNSHLHNQYENYESPTNFNVEDVLDKSDEWLNKWNTRANDSN